MKISETTELVALISMVDNRKVESATVEAWHLIIGGYDFEDCKRALISARQRDDINWLEPKHIVAEIKKLKERRVIEERREKAMEEKEEFAAQPMPQCRHGLGILKCDPCCNAVYKNHTERHHGQPHGDKACLAFIESMSVK